MERFFSFGGRMNRSTYFWGFLISGAFSLALKYAGDPLRSVINANLLLGGFLALCYIAIVILVAWFSLAINMQRMHDLGFSGWYLLTLLIPLVDVGVVVVLLVKKSSPGENKYGADPLLPKS